jgi:glutamyl/glutaminyl-tRNA synthetase
VSGGELSYFFDVPQYDVTMLSWKGESPKEEIKKHLAWVYETLQSGHPDAFQSPESVKSLIFDYATENGRGQVLWPTRVALSGRDKSPDPFTLIYILGKDESLERLHTAIALLA